MDAPAESSGWRSSFFLIPNAGIQDLLLKRLKLQNLKTTRARLPEVAVDLVKWQQWMVVALQA